MFDRRLLLTLPALAAALVSPQPALASPSPKVLVVRGFGDGTGACGAPNRVGVESCPTLRAAVNAANLRTNAPTIELAAGTYRLTLAAGGQLDIVTSMSIVGAGPGGAHGSIIEQTDGKDRVIQDEASPGKVELMNLEVTGGHLAPAFSGQPAVGGGILASGTLDLENVLVTGNEAVGATSTDVSRSGDAADGGGVDFPSGSSAGSLIHNSMITGNAALGGAGAFGVAVAGSDGGGAGGGGILYDGTGALRIDHSMVSGNVAVGGAGGGGNNAGGAGGPVAGGGIEAEGGLTLTAGTVSLNRGLGGSGGTGGTRGHGATAQGGGIFSAAALTVRAGTVDHNTTTGGDGGSSSGSGDGNGGGISEAEAPAVIVNSTIVGNTARGGRPLVFPYGVGYGGGVQAMGSSGALTLSSDTIVANSASDEGGNLDVAVGLSPPYPFQLHDTILAGGTAPDFADCAIFGSTPSAEGNNLEDVSPDQCDLSPAAHDLIGVAPRMAAGLAASGGPARTLAPGTNSPVLQAGGGCLDPVSSKPLKLDERGRPRPSLCDIGAFQHQPPANHRRPAISGSPAVGSTLKCSTGAWSGDFLRFAYQWLRSGAAIRGAHSKRHRVSAGDAGKRLACRLTATGYGSAKATSRAVKVT